MNDGKLNGWILQGFNVLNSLPNKNKTVAGMSKLKFLNRDGSASTESSEFWKNFGESNNVNPADIQTEVFRLPTPVSQKKMVLLLTLVVGLNGTGKAVTNQVKRYQMLKFFL